MCIRDRIKADLHDVGLTTAKTPFGHTVPVYDMERTICDLLRSRSRIEIQTFQGALKMCIRDRLDTLLNIDGKGQAHTESVVAKSTRPSVLDNLKRPVQPRSTRCV